MDAKERISSAKEVVTIVREALIIGGVAVLLFDPGFVSRRAKAINDKAVENGASATEMSYGLGKIAYNNQVQLDALEAMRKQAEATKKLAQEQLTAPSANPANVQRAREIEALSDSIVAQARTGIAEVKTVQLEQVRRQEQTKGAQDAPGLAFGTGVYGIVVSADKQPDQAAFEVQQLRSKNLADVAVYNRQGFLRTVARFPDSRAAQSALGQLQGYRKSAYLVNISHWCPSTQATDQVLANVAVVACE